ncbi:MAG: integrase/recombinase XerD [Algoriphagus sp.]|jgi:integrase/recombinase XerD
MGENLISIQVIGRKILLEMPKNEKDISLVRTIPYVRWNKQTFLWEIPHYPGNIERLLACFGNRVHSITKSGDIPINLKGHSLLQKDHDLVTQTNSERIKLLFGYLTELIKHIKTIPYHHWDAKNKWWTIPYSEQFEGEMEKFCSSNGLKLLKEEEAPKRDWISRLSSKNGIHYKSRPIAYKDTLTDLRYSPKTIKSYVPLFKEFINHFPRRIWIVSQSIMW